MPSFLVVDGTLAAAVEEYAAVVQFYNKSSNVKEEIAGLFKEEDTQVSNELAQVVIKTAQDKYESVPEKEFESLANLAVYLLTFSRAVEENLLGFIRSLVPQQVLSEQDEPQAARNKKQFLRLNSVMSILSNIFNLGSVSVEFKKQIVLVLIQIIKYLKLEQESLNLLRPVIESEQGFVQDEEVFFKFNEAYFPAFPAESIAMLNKFAAGRASAKVDQFAVQAINSEQIVDLSVLLGLQLDAQLAQFISNFLLKEDIVADISQLPAQFRLDTNAVLAKHQYYKFLKLAASSSELSYADIAGALSLADAADVEPFLINVIKTDLIVGKIDQVHQVFKVVKLNLLLPSTGASAGLGELKDNLATWKANLHKVRALIEKKEAMLK